MPKDTSIKKVLVIGSGPIIIGQAAEFDYSGTQAVLSLQEEGVEVVLVNSNPATIMTDPDIANKTYIEPLTLESIAKILYRERPDALLATLGGQTALTLGMQLASKGILEDLNIKMIGCNLETINQAEDRELFKQLMQQMNEPTPSSLTVNNYDQGENFANEVGFPIIVRPAFTMGGSGGGIAYNSKEFETILKGGLNQSPIGQCLVEKSIAGMKEIEYEIMRDHRDNCIVVCNMENLDPVGVHTGDSIVVAPSQTLDDHDYQMLRNSALRIVRALKINGGCNVQFALDPNTRQYYVIEVNPRVSRSSALASKATGYPIAKIAAKIAIGLNLHEIMNPVTQKTYACFEPALDYIVTKIPRWPFDKFESADRKLGTQMKATGEVLAMARSFEESLLKAIRSLEIDHHYPYPYLFENKADDELFEKIKYADDERIFALFELIRREKSIEDIHLYTKIDYWFLNKIKKIIEIEKSIDIAKTETIEQAYKVGMTKGIIEKIVNKKLEQPLVRPVYKMIDTCAAEFEAFSPYFYSTMDQYDELEIDHSNPSIVVIGSGPIRIGQGIEFDYASVHAVNAIKERGIPAVIINNNPETVSTDFSISDRLYFEPLSPDDVLNVLDREKPRGVIVQFGGQTAINLARTISDAGYKVLGTSLENIDKAENREKFEKLLKELDIAQPLGKTVSCVSEAKEIGEQLGFPLIVRPSYVLGGRAMEIVEDQSELENYLKNAIKINKDHPVLIDRYIIGREIEVDAISDGKNVLIPGIMEHIEKAGVHSGDSIAVYPSIKLNSDIKRKIIQTTKKIALGLKSVGLINIQFVLKSNQLYVIEVNPRASRTVPFLSKITNVSMAKVATNCCLGIDLPQQGFNTDYLEEPKDQFFVKAPVFSSAKLTLVETALGPEMKSTGEVMGRGKSFAEAFIKAMNSSGVQIPEYGRVLVTVADRHKKSILKDCEKLYQAGYSLVATQGTYNFLQENKIPCELISKNQDDENNLYTQIKLKRLKLVINTISKSKKVETDGFKMRRLASEVGIACITSLDTVTALIESIKEKHSSIEAMS